MDDPYPSATALLAALAAGEVTSRALVERSLARIAAVDPDLHAFVTVDAEGARRAADACDDARRRGARLGPLHGLPVSVKDAFATAGLRTTAGLVDLATHVPDEDAPAVARLRAAGAVIVGKTSCPEGVGGQETGNRLVGTTRNPWDRTRTTGGSSGGAAAALATGCSALELGSDMGGSIRQPASFCGVCGHYPSHGIVPSRGHLPAVGLDDLDAHEDLMAVGPMARTATDLALALDVLAGPDRLGARAWRLELPPPTVDRVDALRVATWFDDASFPVDREVVEVLERAAGALAAAGAHVDPDARPGFDLVEAERVGWDLWVAMNSASLDDQAFDDLRDRAARLDPDDDRRSARRARAATMPHRRWLHLDATRRHLQRRWEALFERVDVLLCPVVPVTAFPVGDDPGEVDDLGYRLGRDLLVNGEPRPYLDQLVWTTAVGLARLPVTVVPAGVARHGLPVGVQIVGPGGGDRTTLQVGRWLQELLGGWQAPPGW